MVKTFGIFVDHSDGLGSVKVLDDLCNTSMKSFERTVSFYISFFILLNGSLAIQSSSITIQKKLVFHLDSIINYLQILQQEKSSSKIKRKSFISYVKYQCRWFWLHCRCNLHRQCRPSSQWLFSQRKFFKILYGISQDKFCPHCSLFWSSFPQTFLSCCRTSHQRWQSELKTAFSPLEDRSHPIHSPQQRRLTFSQHRVTFLSYLNLKTSSQDNILTLNKLLRTQSEHLIYLPLNLPPRSGITERLPPFSSFNPIQSSSCIHKKPSSDS